MRRPAISEDEAAAAANHRLGVITVNDTPRHAAETLRKRGMSRAPENDVRRALERHFSYLEKEGLELSTLAKLAVTDQA